MLKEVIDIIDLLDDPGINGEKVKAFLKENGEFDEITVKKMKGEKGHTDFITITIKGNGNGPTLGVIGRLGGIGARPEMIGLVSDGDGAVAALSVALKLGKMKKRKDLLPGDVIISTHIDPDALTSPHEPVPFMGSSVDIKVMNEMEVKEEMDAILSIDTTKGNRIINHRGFAISPTVKDGWILKVSDDLLDIMERVTGELPYVFAITNQDITPYGNNVFHLNSIMQPAVSTDAPVVGVAITSSVPVPGCGTGASHETDIELAARFVVEVAKDFTRGKIAFYDKKEYDTLLKLYGRMSFLKR